MNAHTLKADPSPMRIDHHSASQCAQWTSTVPIVLAAAVSFGSAWFYKIKAEKTKKQQLEPWPEVRPNRHMHLGYMCRMCAHLPHTTCA